MNTHTFLEALNHIDDKYIEETAKAVRDAPRREALAPRIFSWASAAAACALVIFALCLIGKYGRPQATTVPDEEVVSSACNARETTQEESAQDFPQLSFPTEEEFARIDDGTRGSISDCRAYRPISMTQEQIASIWGEAGLSWADIPENGEWELSGDATYDDDGKLIMAEVFCRPTDRDEHTDLTLLKVVVTPQHIPTATGEIYSLSNSNQVYGKEVEAFAQYDPSASAAASGPAYENAHYQVAFLREGQGETLGVRATAFAITPADREGMMDRLSRLAWLSLDPENTLTLDGLRLIAETEGLPEIDFADGTQGGRSPIGLLENSIEYRWTIDLTQKDIRSIWGSENTLFWEGQVLDGLFHLSGKAYFAEDGTVAAVQIICSIDTQGEKGHSSADVFCVNLFPGGLPENDFFEGNPTKTTQVLGTAVEACKQTLSDTTDGETIPVIEYKARLDQVGEEDLGVEITGLTALGSDGKLYLSRLLDEDRLQKLISQCVCQMFEPGQTLRVSQLAGDRATDDMGGAEISADGTAVYSDPDVQTAYLALCEQPAVKKGGSASSEAGDDAYDMTLTLCYPKIYGTQKREDGSVKLIFYVDSKTYAFDFDKKVVKSAGGFSGPAGIDSRTPETPWFPGDGDRYAESIQEYCGEDSADLAEQLINRHQTAEDIRVLENQLYAYMEQNNMTGWKMRDVDRDLNEIFYPFGPREEDQDESWGPRVEGEELTLNQVVKLSQKGNALTLGDLDGYAHYDGGSGLYIPMYPVGDGYVLVLNGVSNDDPPFHAMLTKRENSEQVEIRQEDVKAFLQKQGDWETVLEEAAEEVAKQYADSWLSMKEDGYPPLAECFYTDLSWAESPDPGSDIQVSCRLVFRLEDPDGNPGNWMAGNTAPGAGEYEGYYTAYRFIYAKLENGQWKIVSSGTGP